MYWGHDDEDHRGLRLSYNCDRGPAFRTFKRDFFARARGKFAKDDRNSFLSCYRRLDEGGTATGAPSLPSQSGGSGGGIVAIMHGSEINSP